jgi:hypothetical protein
VDAISNEVAQYLIIALILGAPLLAALAWALGRRGGYDAGVKNGIDAALDVDGDR